jgi:predicted HTH domain antitoxin
MECEYSMSKVTIEVDVPQGVNDAELAAKFSATAARVLTEQTVLRLYQDGEISTGTGARLLGMSVHDFIQFLGRHRIPVLNYEAGELEAELNEAQKRMP